MTTTIGNHRFSEGDVRSTLKHAVDLLDLYPARAQPYLAETKRVLTEEIAMVDLRTEPIEKLAPLLERVWLELLDARQSLDKAGLLPGRSEGRVDQLNVSGGGVPKTPVIDATVDYGGLQGDIQASRVHHGRPWQALCLWSSEIIADLADQGHPIAPGSAGENLTISGLDWTDVFPGVRVGVGSVLCQISSYSIPCSKNAQWFSDRDISRIHHENGDLSRVYATVLTPGSIIQSDPVVVEP